MTKQKQLRIGLIGAGRTGYAQATQLRHEPDVQIVAISDIIQEHAELIAREWNGRIYTDYRALFSTEDLDAVYICTPTDTHVEIARPWV